MRASEFLTEAGAVPIYYFAYGMLTDPKIMRGADFVGTAVLKNFEYEMFQYANVNPQSGSHVVGVLWALDRNMLAELDRTEGYPHLYDRKTVPVYVDGNKVVAELYTMTPETREHLEGTKPRKTYVARIARGYQAAGVPMSQLVNSIRPKQPVEENFANGKGPGRAGDSQRHGIPKHATMAELEKASHAGGRKGQLARWQLNMRRGKKANEGLAEDLENYQGIEISIEKENDEIIVKALSNGRELGHVLFVDEGEYLMPQDLEVDERYRGQGIARIMYDYVKSKGYRIRRSGQQTDAGAGFWDKHKPGKNIWEAFDQPYKLKWEKGDYGDVDAYTKLDDGNYLSIMFNKGYNQDREEAWNVEFYRNNSQEVTGEGDQQRVFATVLGAIQTFIKKYKPNRVIFSASKEVEPGQNSESRARLYDSLVQRYARAWGFKSFRADTGDKVIYELSRINQVKEDNVGTFTSLQQVKDHFRKMGKSEAQAAAAWQRGYRGPVVKKKEVAAYDPAKHGNQWWNKD